MSRRNVQKWLTRLSVIHDSYPFGPIKIRRNELGQIHCADGPALISPTRVTWFENGKRHGRDVDIFGSVSYFFRGVLVPRKFIIDPENLSYEEVLSHVNTEVRRVGMEIYGFDRLVEEGKAKIIHQDDKLPAILFQVDTTPVNGNLRSEEDHFLVIVKVRDGTQCIDGSYKSYFLQVPPSIKHCKEAVAWTFKRDEKTYHPSIER